MIRAVSRSSRLGKYRYMAEETMPISRAAARRDARAAPSGARWRRAASVSSRISSARIRSRAVRLTFTTVTLAEQCTQTRAVLGYGCSRERALLSLWTCAHGGVGYGQAR